MKQVKKRFVAAMPVLFRLLRRGAAIVDLAKTARDCTGYTLLTLVVHLADEPLTQGLLCAGCDAKGSDNHGNTVLHYLPPDASSLIPLLMHQGAEIDAVGYGGMTPMHSACARRCTYVVQGMLQFKPDLDLKCVRKQTPLHYAASAGDERMIVQLLQDGADVNAVDECGHAPLHSYCERKDAVDITPFLRHGAQIDMRDGIDGTPLINACRIGNIEIVRQLLHNGAVDNATNQQQFTVLYTACDYEHPEIVALLLQHFSTGVESIPRQRPRVQLNISGARGASLLRTAVMRENVGIARLLIEAGATPHEFTRLTLLSVALKAGSVELVTTLLEIGASVKSLSMETVLRLSQAARDEVEGTRSFEYKHAVEKQRLLDSYR